MTEVNNLDKLLDKVYQEGIEKARADSKSIISEAQATRDQILDEARNEANKIISDANREAERVTRSVENELQLKGKQFLSDLKVQIQRTLTEKILINSTSGAFADNEFLKSAILEAISHWKATDELELILPKPFENKLEKAFYQSIRNHAKNLIIKFDDKINGGFRIAEKDGAYQISFTESDFINLFTSYVEKQTEKLLFAQPK